METDKISERSKVCETQTQKTFKEEGWFLFFFLLLVFFLFSKPPPCGFRSFPEKRLLWLQNGRYLLGAVASAPAREIGTDSVGVIPLVPVNHRQRFVLLLLRIFFSPSMFFLGVSVCRQNSPSRRKNNKHISRYK